VTFLDTFVWLRKHVIIPVNLDHLLAPRIPGAVQNFTKRLCCTAVDRGRFDAFAAPNAHEFRYQGVVDRRKPGIASNFVFQPVYRPLAIRWPIPAKVLANLQIVARRSGGKVQRSIFLCC
jgi:hypothetical protein